MPHLPALPIPPPRKKRKVKPETAGKPASEVRKTKVKRILKPQATKNRMAKYLTVTDIEMQEGNAPIWALNGSSQSEVGQAGEVHVGIPKVNGSSKIDALHLPQTFLPICLTEQIPRSQLIASSEFRGAVNSRLLILITAEYAEEILQSEGVEDEKERLFQLRRQVRDATAARSITQSGADIVNTAELEDATQKIEGSTDTEDTGLSTGFEMFANNLVTQPDVQIMNAIRGRGRMNRREINHLQKLLHDKPKTLEFLARTLNKA